MFSIAGKRWCWEDFTSKMSTWLADILLNKARSAPFFAAVENYWPRAPITSYYNSINIFRMIMDNETLWICFIPFRNCRCIVHMYRIQKASCNGISDAYEKILTIEDVSWSLERLLYLRFDIQKCIFYKIQPWIWHETILRNIKLKRIRSQNILLC